MHSSDPGHSRGLVPRWGATHIHTTHSDGGVSVADTVTAARRAGLDFVHITDHNTLGAREDEGYLDEVLVVADVEVSPTPWRNHVVALGLEDYPGLHSLKDPVEILQAIESLGAFAWVPHPRGFSNLWFAIWNAPWETWSPVIRGLEIGTYCVDWFERLRPWKLAQLRSNPKPHELRPDPQTMDLWDQLNADPTLAPLNGFVGLDAHYRQLLGGRLHTPTYEHLFGTFNLLAWTHPPTGDGAKDARDLREALRDGRFVNIMLSGGGRGEVVFERTATGFRIEAPDRRHTSIRIYRDAKPFQQVSGSTLELMDPRPGQYRAEVLIEQKLWAVTNPLTVVPSKRPAVEPQTASGTAYGHRG